jgi:ketosteroid isomerase-like protein
MSKEAADPVAEPHSRYMDACRKGDVPAILSLYSNTAVMMPPNEPSLYGKKELEEWHQEYFAAFQIVTLDQTDREVMVFEEYAVERWAYLVAIESLSGTDRIRDDGRFLTLWKREGSVWRIAQSMFNSTRPVGSGTTRFLMRLTKQSAR